MPAAPMTISECLLLAQTGIFFLTGVVVLWYTWETHQLRKLTRRQSELVQQQLTTMQESLRLDVQEQTRRSRQVFRWLGGHSSADVLYREFRNEGGPISHLSIHAEPTFRACLSRTDLIRENETGEVALYVGTEQRPEEITFEIRYRTRLNVQGAKAFVWNLRTVSLREIEPDV